VTAPARFKDLCLDAADHQALADWWCAAIGYRRRDTLADGSPRDRSWPLPIEDPGGAGPVMWIVPVPEPKTVKNRIHWDVSTADVGLLVERGATVLREPDGDIRWTVMADPEGNEFCAFTPVPLIRGGE